MPPEEVPPRPAPPPQPDLDAIGSDALAALEVDRESKKESKELFGDPKRHEELKQAIHIALIWLLRIAVVVFAVVLLIRVLHFILPENCAANAGTYRPHGWLTENQLAGIDRSFFHGAIGAFIARYLRQIIPGNS